MHIRQIPHLETDKKKRTLALHARGRRCPVGSFILMQKRDRSCCKPSEVEAGWEAPSFEPGHRCPCTQNIWFAIAACFTRSGQAVKCAV